jgi:hypothetical protein
MRETRKLHAQSNSSTTQSTLKLYIRINTGLDGTYKKRVRTARTFKSVLHNCQAHHKTGKYSKKSVIMGDIPALGLAKYLLSHEPHRFRAAAAINEVQALHHWMIAFEKK